MLAHLILHMVLCISPSLDHDTSNMELSLHWLYLHMLLLLTCCRCINFNFFPHKILHIVFTPHLAFQDIPCTKLFPLFIILEATLSSLCSYSFSAYHFTTSLHLFLLIRPCQAHPLRVVEAQNLSSKCQSYIERGELECPRGQRTLSIIVPVPVLSRRSVLVAVSVIPLFSVISNILHLSIANVWAPRSATLIPAVVSVSFAAVVTAG